MRVEAVTSRALVTLLVAVATAGCGGDTSSDRGGEGDPGAEDAGRAPDSDAPPDSPGFESLAWRSSLDYGSEGPPRFSYKAVHGTGAVDLFVAGVATRGLDFVMSFVDHFAGDQWEPVFESSLTLGSVWGSAPSSAFVVGGSSVVRVEHLQVTAEDLTLDSTLLSVWGWTEDNVVAVGTGGTIVQYDGEEWSLEDSGTGVDLLGVWGSDPDHVFAVGDGGVILNRRGDTAWTAMESGTSLNLRDVWGSGPTDVYAVGGRDGNPGHVILHYDGSAWSAVDTGDDRVSVLLGVAGRSAADVCAVGAYRGASETAHALVLRFDGTSWQELPVEAETFLYDVWPAGSDAYLVVGPDDTLALVRD